MARDYKNRSSRKGEASHGRLTGLLTFIAGIVTGLGCAVIFYLVYGIPDTGGFVKQRLPAEKTPTQAAAPEEKTQAAARQSPPAPRFDFYTILPEMEVSVPEWEGEAATAAKREGDSEAEALEPAPAGERYILQIGSFRQPDEAERVKARLALLGIETEIQRVVSDGGDIWHRVRAGPYRSSGRLNQTRQRLIDNDIDFLLLKLKQEG